MLEIDPELMSDNIKCIVFRIDTELKQLSVREKQLKITKLNLQSICAHEFKPDGHTHGGSYETCHICGITQRQ